MNIELYLDRVRAICLPIAEKLRNYAVIGNKVTVAGWGTLQENGNSSNTLQKVKLEVLENDSCEKSFVEHYKLVVDRNEFDKRVLCAGK